MKVKELQKTVNVAWSPAQQNSISLAAGTAAQQLDASNGNSVLEIYSANLDDPGYDLELKGSQTSQYRFQKIVWSPTGINGGLHPNGLIVGGCESGHLQIYSASRLLAREEALVAHQDKHSGPIRGLDFNQFQHNLLASVASESEIFIWDLNNTMTPMSPGTKTQPLEDVQNVAWNKQVQHILASVYSSRCVIWDLRKNEQIIKLSDSQSRVRWRAIQWHPDIATQLWLASEEDQAPYVQLWDLRYATSPAKTLQIHQRGILGLTWCPRDTDLMVSCGKDNKIYCWNPNSELPGGEILSEIATTIQWYSDVQWCPRNPALIASSSLEGNVSIYSVMGGSHQQVQTSNKIADSFPGMDQFAQAPMPQQTTQTVYSDLSKAPKWMKRPAGASFGFGGRLISFNQKTPRQVTIGQVVTEPELVQRSVQLETTLASGNFTDYCRQKADQMTDQHGRYVWYFLKANFEANPRAEMLNLLGYDPNDMSTKFTKYTEESKATENNVDQITNQMATLSRGGDNNALFDALAAGNKSLNDQQNGESKDFEYKIQTDGDNEGLICQAILSGNVEAAVDMCMKFGRPAEAIIIAMTGGSELLSRTQYRFLKKTDGYLSNIISALIMHDWTTVVSQCTVDSWKEALVAALTHSQEQLGVLCEKLGDRLQTESGKDSPLAKNAILCYICAGNIEKLVEAWLQLQESATGEKQLTTKELQDLVEIVMLMQKYLELQGRNVQLSGKLADFLSNYAKLLASQGALDSALSYLGPSSDPEITDLRSRLEHALGRTQRTIKQSQPTGYYNQQTAMGGSRLPQSRTTSLSNSLPPLPVPAVNSFNSGLPGMLKPSQPPPQPTVQPWNNSLGQPPAVPTFNPLQPQAPAAPFMPPPAQAKPSLPPPSVNDTLPQPQRPPSVGSQGATPLSRSKYIVDPSVASGPSYGQTTNFYNSPQPPMNFNAQPFGSAAPNQFNPQPFGSAQPTNQFPSNPPTANSFKPFVPAPGQGALSGSGFNNSYLPGMPTVEMAQQATASQPPPQRNPTPPPGWNDPPALRPSRQQPKVETSLLNPITHPLFGADPNPQPQNGYPDPNIAYQNSQYQANQPPPPMGQSQQQMPGYQLPNYPNQMNFQSQSITPGYQQQEAPPPPAMPEPPKEKPPLPEEFVYLQTVLEELKNQCLNVASDPRTKRKFVDVAKRLENLYDLLREGRLTPNTQSALNQIVQYVQIGDYHNAMGTYTAIVSGPDFAQTANFMPGIKVLLQSASELKIYLR